MTRTASAIRFFTIVIPLFNDWTSVARLIRELDDLGGDAAMQGVICRVLIVNDGSTVVARDLLPEMTLHRLASVDILHLAYNVGHQRAIAIGLVHAAQEVDLNGVIVMDADGEDRPADVGRLIAASQGAPDRIICAQRTHRSESLLFRMFYWMYRSVFRAFTGCSIDFGNFCLIPKQALQSLIRNSGIWNHLAATVVRSKANRLEIATTRGTRFDGQATMDFVSLVVHGLSAVSLFSDVALVRLMVVAAGLGVSTLIGVLIVVGIRVLTDLAIPGWATNVVGLLLIILLQAIVLSVISTFMLLNARSAKGFMPITDAPPYVARCESVAVGRVRSETA